MKHPPPQEPGEDMNVRAVHGALWREFEEPMETLRRLPWYMRHLYAVMLLIGLIYLLIQVFDWNEYEESATRRVLRDIELHQAPPPPAIPNPTPPAR